MTANPIRWLYEGRGRQWPMAEAEVDSCTWVEGRDNLGSKAGQYDVAFSYKPNGSSNIYHGHFAYPGTAEVMPYRPHEAIPIQYNPHKPSRYTYPGDTSRMEKVEAILVMALFALIAGYLLYAI